MIKMSKGENVRCLEGMADDGSHWLACAASAIPYELSKARVETLLKLSKARVVTPWEPW